jgi:putative transposase
MRKDGCLTLTNAHCAREVLYQVDRAFKAFFRRCKNGGKPGFPRYKSFRRYDSLTYTNGYKLLSNGKLYIQGAGHVKIKLQRPVEGKIKTVTIKRKAGKWYVCFSVECQPHPLPLSNEKVGIDVGLSSFLTLSNGGKVENPRYYRKAQAKLRVCQRKVARRKKGSRRRRKAVALLQRAHVKIQDQRSDFHHKVSRELVNYYGKIVVEDLNVKGLTAGMLAKSVNDAGWRQFLNFLSYKAESAGREFHKVDPRGTSQICVCGASVPKTLADRWHVCPACGLSADRDEVSAMVILQRAGNRPSGVNVDVVNSCVA